MVNLRIRACADGVVVGFVCQEDNGLVKCDMPVAYTSCPIKYLDKSNLTCS